MNRLSLRTSRFAISAVLAPVAALATLLGPMVAEAAPTARLTATRTSGPAPLAVFFDATGTTDSTAGVEAFRQLGYRFTFGDSGAGNWQHTGRSKNEQVGGPLAAHVFDQPGTYTVQVEAKDASGASSVANVTITVQSPDSVFPGTRTVCLSRNTDFAGCPSGAQQVASAGSWPTWQSGYRYLLHRGQDFTALGRLNYGQGGNGISDGHIGAFGSGAKPLVGNVWIDSGILGDSTWHRRVVVADLDALQIEQDTGGFDLLVYRNSVVRGGGIHMASAFGFMLINQTNASSWRNPENIFVVDNNVDMNYARDQSVVGITGQATHFALMGNSVDRTWEQNMRIWQGYKTFIGHNSLTGRCGEQIRGVLKFHAIGTDPVGNLVPGRQDRQRATTIVIADNLLGSVNSNINWLAGTSPQNIEEAEGIENAIWEDNQFRHGINYARDITWYGRNFTERGNWNHTENGNASSGVPQVSPALTGWNGPYYTQQTSMKTRFSGAVTVRPNSPSGLVVE